MKSLLVVSAALILVTSCFAQGNGITPVGVGGFGNILHPGTGGSPASFPVRLGATVQGYPNGPYVNGTKGGGPKRSTIVTAYPLYVGGAYVPAYAPDYSGQTQLYSQPQYQAPPVVINQYFGQPATAAQEPVTTFYQPSANHSQAADEDSAPAPNKYYLLAFKDHSIYSALAYWVEDTTLHYVTTHNTHNQASLDLVDVDFTVELNRDRAVPFSLTPSK